MKVLSEFPNLRWLTVHWPIISVDLNGVLDTYSGWEGQYKMYPPTKDAPGLLKRFKEAGYTVVVTTAQPPEQFPWLEVWFYRSGLGQYVDFLTNFKLPSHAYVDDKAVCYRGQSPEVLLVEVKDFQPHWASEQDHDGPTEEQKKKYRRKQDV